MVHREIVTNGLECTDVKHVLGQTWKSKQNEKIEERQKGLSSKSIRMEANGVFAVVSDSSDVLKIPSCSKIVKPMSPKEYFYR